MELFTYQHKYLKNVLNLNILKVPNLSGCLMNQFNNLI